MKTKIKYYISLLSSFLYTTICLAVIPLGTALNKPQTVTESIPIDFTKTGVMFEIEYKFPIDNTNRAIPDRFYKNVQMTEYDSVGSRLELAPVLYRKFSIPNNNNILAVVNFGGATCHTTNVLCVVNPNGQILSTLIGEVCYAEITIRQFRINAQCQILRTTLTTNATASIPLANLTSFIGQRKDEVFSINAQGQFVLVSTQLFQPKTYTADYLMDFDSNLWQGNEVLLP